MTQWAILYPVFVQAALTFGLLFTTGISRVRAIERRDVRVKDIALGQDNWPERITKIGNSYNNQLQTPVLFYIVIVLALMTSKVSGLFIIMAWGFVALRLAHAYVHVTSNDVPKRFMIFLAGLVVLVLMWLIFVLRLLTEGV